MCTCVKYQILPALQQQNKETSGLDYSWSKTGTILKASSRSLLSCLRVVDVAGSCTLGRGDAACALCQQLPAMAESVPSPLQAPTMNDPLRTLLLSITLCLEWAWVGTGVIFSEEMLPLSFQLILTILPIVCPAPANTAQSCLGLQWPSGAAELCCTMPHRSQVCTSFMCLGRSCLSVPVEFNTQHSCDGLKRDYLSIPSTCFVYNNLPCKQHRSGYQEVCAPSCLQS